MDRWTPTRSGSPGRLLAALALLGPSCGQTATPEPGAALASSSPQAPGDPPTARRGTLDELRTSHYAPRHRSDGGGRAWIEGDPDDPSPAVVGAPGTWTIVYEAGPEGVRVGGSVRLIVSPFWNWSAPQTRRPDAVGYTTVECEAEGVQLDVRTPQWVIAVVKGRDLRRGERIRFTYGAGPAGALADRYAERNSRFWIAVDGDGDGLHRVLEDSPAVDVLPGPPARLSWIVPSTAKPGQAVTTRMAVLDAVGNAGTSFVGGVELIAAPATIGLPESVRFEKADAGTIRFEITPQEAGVYRLVARATADGDAGPGELIAESNPLLVEADGPRILWGDLHGHSNYSDGTGEPEDFLRYARDVAGLDVVALTDHDHWGMLFLDENPEMWEHIKELNRTFLDPGRFVTVLGFEWTNWIHGHRHVLYFEDDGPVLSSIDPDYETPRQLWDGLEGHHALTFAHHSAGGPIATDWSFAPDPRFEPVTEVASVHGSSEAADSPLGIYDPLAGNHVRDALGMGYRLGFIGSGDGHDGHPGLAAIAGGGRGGLAALLSEELTREGVHGALMARQCYASNGPRIVLRCALGGHRMGSSIPAGELASDGPTALYFRVIACAPIDHVDVVRNADVVQRVDGEKAWDFASVVELDGLEAGDFVYVRAVQVDLGTAWSSPFFVE